MHCHRTLINLGTTADTDLGNESIKGGFYHRIETLGFLQVALGVPDILFGISDIQLGIFYRRPGRLYGILSIREGLLLLVNSQLKLGYLQGDAGRNIDILAL